MDERCLQAHVAEALVADPQGVAERVDEGAPAVRVDEVIPGVHADQHGISLAGDRDGVGERDEDRVPVRDDRERHVLGGVVAVRHLDGFVGERRTGEHRPQRQVQDVVPAAEPASRPAA
jgi:hypothetical protein